ncbi:bifunctional 2-polyprenyl-6-hydroxyphenol methylase/3-demethylubiquinol 3-O-methyltransferase UbiG [Polynucleobacter sp. 80A-SIGWE]|uniref:class I SAM-dependent methyltransferase n=1 Tax=Polynucleobacter sp. 80A-SIGWE TaxID=2689100 RepID=UPI001C0B8419|nr:methyltransferase domain-containing protein [Polynucleobacter sp. 80A-SIGWE]MBU3589077.1 hypothetical protein [Polynucleobacter sp. 80A-SIGWE]
MINAFSPFYDSPPNDVELEYLNVLREHHNNFFNFTLKIINDFNFSSAIEIGSYLTNVAVRLKPHLQSMTATDVETGNSRENYRKWANKFGVKVGINSITSNGIRILSKEDNCRYDIFLASEILEHLPFNPLPIIKSIKHYLNDDGVVVVSVPNRLSLAKIVRFILGRHPYIKFNEFSSEDYILANYGHHWLEYNVRDLDYVFEICGFKRIALKTVNINYKKKLSFVAKQIIRLITLGLVFDQIYAAYRRSND